VTRLSPIAAQRTEGGASRGIHYGRGPPIRYDGWLGLSKDAAGRSAARAFPARATLPSWQSPAEGQLWHFFFAWLFVLNGRVYLLFGLLNLHLWRDMVPRHRAHLVQARRARAADRARRPRCQRVSRWLRQVRDRPSGCRGRAGSETSWPKFSGIECEREMINPGAKETREA